MTQENKELLLKDICARLPYGIKCKAYDCINYPYEGDGFIIAIGRNYIETTYSSEEGIFPVGRVLPYLRPMSSMTEEEFKKLTEYSGLKYEQLDLASFQNGTYKCLDFYLSEVPSYVVILVFDWLNKHHFDYRGFIEKNLALDCTGLHIYD